MGLMDLFKKKSSGDVAKDRLKLLLVTDLSLIHISEPTRRS